MARTLLNNINSNYFNALNALKGKTHRERIVAYVESYDDVSFWRNILDAYENDKRYFEVMLMPSKTYNVMPHRCIVCV